jgi:hypothetical protein
MAENERPLPTPPRTRFGRQLRGEEEGTGPLTADRLTQAAAEGRLEEVLQREIPEGEHARNLALMMLGMSGMMPPGMPGMPAAPEVSPAAPSGSLDPGIGASSVDPAARDGLGGSGVLPPEVLAATMQGDVAGLTALLRAEHERRRGEVPGAGESPGGAPGFAPSAAAGVEAPQLAAEGPADAARAGIDKALVDEMIRVAGENQVTVDWLVLRAVKLYLEEHRRTGRL